MLEHFREVVDATALPVNADFQNAYADEAEDVAANVQLCPLYNFDLAVARIRAARAAIDNSGVPVVLTARCEAWLVGDPEPLRTSLERLAAFADAGADCLYAPGVMRPEEISQIVKEASPLPVNVLISTNNCNLTVSQLEDLGVRRISIGGALARAAWGGFAQAAKEIRDTGSFTAFREAMPFDELNGLFAKRLA
jgi:methylisocitrate lyase